MTLAALRRTAYATLGLALGAGGLHLLGAQAPADPGPLDTAASRVFERLAGSWVGEGELMGRAATFSMEWSALVDGFARLRFRNAWVSETSDTTHVLRAEAVYRTDGSSVLGVWIDDRPQRIELVSEVTDTSLVTNWSSEAERGRTEYVVAQSGSVTVRDWVEMDGVLRPFGEARYRRRR